MSTPVLLIVGGLLTAMAVSTIQSRYMEDGRGRSLLKGVASGLLVGLPLPVAGTGVGGLVLALSGLNHLLDPDSSEGTDSPSRPKSR